jgi:hypothetical protein
VELYLQFGYGMMEHSRHLLRSWGGGTVILSPRDLEPSQLQRFSTDILSIGNSGVLFDPQFYLPHADHARLRQHDYWPQQYDTGNFWSGQGLVDLVTRLRDLNRVLGCHHFILPGLLAASIDDDWLAHQTAILETASQVEDDLPLLLTLALSSDALRSQDQIHDLLDVAAGWNPAGLYVVCEHPNGEYLVNDPIWLANILDLLAGLRLRGKQVIVGYCTHQFLIAGLAKVTSIASGTWMNVRSFPPAKFYADYEDEIRRRAIWYYCPQGLSEYTLPFLDLAHAQGLLPTMAPAPSLGSNYVARLFSGAQPTTVGLDEPSAFRHYLHCLHAQVSSIAASSFDDALATEERRLEDARRLLTQLQRAGVLGQLRDFFPVLDSNLAALRAHSNTRGHQMRRRWNSL